MGVLYKLCYYVTKLEYFCAVINVLSHVCHLFITNIILEIKQSHATCIINLDLCFMQHVNCGMHYIINTIHVT